MEYQERRQQQAQATRQAILDAAVALASEVGYEKLNIRDVCARAGVTTGAFYHHFTGKKDLLNQGFTSLDAHLEKALIPYLDRPPLERLRILLQLYAGYMEDLGWETVSLYYTHRLADPEAESMSPQRYTLKAMEDCLSALVRSGELPPTQSPRWISQFFFRHFRGLVIDWVLRRGEYSLRDRLEEEFTFFEGTLRA